MQIETIPEFIQDASLFEWFFLIFILILPLILITLIITQHILGYFLAKKYDIHFFKPPYFTNMEVAVYCSWPLSLIRYATYITYTGFPSILHKRRFKSHASPYIPSRMIRFVCQFWVMALVICIITGPTLLIMMFALAPRSQIGVRLQASTKNEILLGGLGDW